MCCLLTTHKERAAKCEEGVGRGERGTKRSVRCHAGGNVIRRLSAQVSASSKERASLGDAGGSRLLLLGLLLVQELLERPDGVMIVAAHVTCESPLLVCRVASSSVCVWQPQRLPHSSVILGVQHGVHLVPCSYNSGVGQEQDLRVRGVLRAQALNRHRPRGCRQRCRQRQQSQRQRADGEAEVSHTRSWNY